MNLMTLMCKIGADTSEFDSAVEGAKSTAEGFGAKAVAVGNLVSKGLDVAISAARNLAGDVIETGKSFDTAVSQIAATSGKSVAEIQDLADAAKHLGSTTAFTATEAAEGINILAMAGLTAAEILGDGADDANNAISTVLNLAAAGSLSLESSATYVTGAVKGFGKSMDDAAYFADLMAKGATLANTNVAGLGEALSQSAATAASYNQDADGVTLSLLRLANQNVTGSEAATALNRAMQDLYAPTDAAKTALKELGVAVYDSNGNARDFNTIVDEMAGALDGMNQEQATAYKNTIFSTFGMQAFNKMTAASADEVQKFSDGLEGAGGSAGQQAATMLDNLEGKMTLFASAADGMKLSLYNAFSGSLGESVGFGTDLLNNMQGAFDSGGIEGLMTYLAETITENIPIAMDALTTGIVDGINYLTENKEEILNTAIGILGALADGFRENFPLVINAMAELVIGIADYIVNNWDSILNTGISIVMAIADGMCAVPLIFIDAIVMLLGDIGNEILAWASEALAYGASIVQSIADGFTQKKDAAVEKVTEIIDTIRTFFEELPEKAMGWAKDMMDGFIKGIQNNPITNAISGVADTISSFIHFSRPEEGALHNYDQWMPDFMHGLAEGIKNNAWMVEDAVSGLSANMSVNAQQAKYSDYFGTANQNQNVTVVLEGDAAAVFKLVQNQNRNFFNATGRSAFA